MSEQTLTIESPILNRNERLAQQLRERFQAHALKTCRDTRIEAAGLGNQAAMYGCAYEALRLRREGAGK